MVVTALDDRRKPATRRKTKLPAEVFLSAATDDTGGCKVAQGRPRRKEKLRRRRSMRNTMVAALGFWVRRRGGRDTGAFNPDYFQVFPHFYN